MRMPFTLPGVVLATFLLALGTLSCSHSGKAAVSGSWNAKAAAAYLDSREVWWTGWVGSARDHDTYCVSCHTAMPYALARPALRSAMAEQDLSSNERNLINNVIKRVRLGKQTSPYYSEQGYDHKTGESRGTESVLNALILASYDAQGGKLSDDTRAAFDNMWAQQQTSGDSKGAWLWLQFDQEPWEASDSGYYGATLAAMAVGIAPGNYASSADIQDKVSQLREYLNKNLSSQSTINQVFALWASTKMQGLLTPEQQKAVIQEVLSKQQADGGWRLASITWKWEGSTFKSMLNLWVREDGTPLRGKSDGVATGLVTLVLQEAGVPHDSQQLQKGLYWLQTNQTPAGSWPANSVNKQKHQSANTRLFMSDAGTAFAVLSLTKNSQSATPTAAVATR